MKAKRIKSIIHKLILIVLIICILASSYIKIFFGNESIDEFIFYLSNGVSNGDMHIYWIAIQMCIPFFIIMLLIVFSLFYNILIDKDVILKFDNKSIKIYPINFILNHRVFCTVVLCFFTVMIVVYNFNLISFFNNTIIESNFIEDNYIMDKNSIRFYEKRNLIYIYVESLETTLFTKEQGGEWDYEIIPELYNILQDENTISFSANNLNTGMYEQEGGSWTTAAIVASNTGLPFKIPINGNSYHLDNFMNGAYALGDILKDNGYYNEVISGARTNFGGLEEFFTKHGSYNIVDINSLEKNGLSMKNSDRGSWGLNDNYVFTIAKERLLKISKTNQPFNLTVISIDTHPQDGFVGEYTLNKFQSQYENVYATESKIIGEFVDWIKEQDFYENTTIVIVGDHLNMQTEYFKNKENNRYIYNAIINTKKLAFNDKNRIFTAMDMYPTTISAIGGIIDGEQLGLGINLFSDKYTLSEKYGLEEVNDNLAKKSLFYNTYILGSDYFELSVRK